jgi:hypothetical protein
MEQGALPIAPRFVTLTSLEVDPAIRVTKWQNSYKHCNHGAEPSALCARAHGERPEDIKALRDFVQSSENAFPAQGQEVLDVSGDMA